jgi:hypothetical protein
LPCQSRLNPDMLQYQVLCECGGCSAVLAVLDVTESWPMNGLNRGLLGDYDDTGGVHSARGFTLLNSVHLSSESTTGEQDQIFNTKLSNPRQIDASNRV